MVAIMMRQQPLLVVVWLGLVLLPMCLAVSDCQLEEEWFAHPILCRKVQELLWEPDSMRSELYDWALTHGLIVSPPPLSQSSSIEMIGTAIQRQRHLRSTTSTTTTTTTTTDSDGTPTTTTAQYPVVMAHGMGDSCFNDGMQHVTERISSLLGGIYSTCIPTGDTVTQDTNNGYFLNMDASVDVFAARVKADALLQHGFHAMGFSQGNNVIRGYIARYNDPPVHTFISVNGVNAGEGAVPYCRPSEIITTRNTASKLVGFSMCDLLMEQASRAAYTEYAQQHSFQANYWRDPRESEFPTYQKYAQLANWNNEGLVFNQTLKDNWAKTKLFVWVMATQDEMVWPLQGEQWGAPDPKDPFNTILPREETPWFQQDLFGLKSAEEEGKNVYEQFDGNHLQFEWDDFDRWVKTYFT
jgi:palmitoyl-protein thioesterase